MAEEWKKLLFISLEDYSWMGDHYSDFLSTLRSKSDFISHTDLETTTKTLKDGSISVVILFEPSVIDKKIMSLIDALISFTKAGGTTILAGLCSSFCRPSAIDEFFGKWNLPWESGDYFRTILSANPRARLNLTAEIATSYSMKALHLKNVATEDLLYVTTNDSKLESLVFPAQQVDLAGEGPIVFAPYHQGRIGWVGDVNNEPATGLVVLAMAGL